MAYNEIYEVTTCTLSGVPIRIVLSKKENNPPLAPIEKLGVLGFKIKGKRTDVVTEPINGSEITCTFLSSPTFNADSLATEDEREWRTDVYRNGTLFWSGFNLPEGLNEPYGSGPYNITINANDALGNLQKIPFSDGLPYTEYDTDKNIIVKCLLKTGLNLPIVIGVNMFATGMNTNNSPLTQSSINQTRFIDKNSSPFSCHEVLRSILARYGAKLFQAEGAWYIINTLEQTKGNVKAWRFSSTGTLIGTEQINRTATAGPVGSDAPIIDDTHNIGKARAFKSAMAYYQYGFINNAIGNGNFNTLEGDFLKDWEKIGGVTASVSQSTETNQETGVVVVTGHVLRITGSSTVLTSAVRSKTPIQVRANEKVSISFEASTPGTSFFNGWFVDLLITDNSGRHYTKNGWQSGPGFYTLGFPPDQMGMGLITPISFDIPGGPTDYQLTFAFTQIRNENGNKADSRFDNLSITPAVNDAALNPAIGNYLRLTQTKNLTFVPEPILLLHGDEPNNLRTSQILIDGVASTTWSRTGFGLPNENVSLLYLVADSYLRLNSGPKKLFDATFASTKLISPLTQFSISLLPGSFHYLSGDFDLLREEYTLSLFESLNGAVSIIQPYEIGVDTGNLKDGQGNSIGAPTGVSNPPVNNPGPGSEVSARLTIEDGYLYIDGDKANAGYADYAAEAGHALTADLAYYADDSDLWDGADFVDFLDQPVRTTDDVEFVSVETDLLQSHLYVSGFTGSGYRLTPEGLEIDNITVRKTLNVNVLNIREITGSGGSIAITNVAKIDKVTDMGSYWKCDINTDEGTIAVQLRANDLVRCQVWDGKGIKYYNTRVTSVSTGSFNLSKAEKVGSGIPAKGDAVFQFGNTTDTARQGLLYLTNSDTGAPYLDILDGINSESLVGKTRVRLGKLDGLNIPNFPTMGGYGLYGDNVYLEGQFMVTGGNAETKAGAQAKADAVVIGAANLLRNSSSPIVKAAGVVAYQIGSYFIDRVLTVGKEYTLVVKGSNSGVGSLGVWVNGSQEINASLINDESGVTKIARFTRTASGAGTAITFYHYPTGSNAGASSVEWACLYEGSVNVPLVWVASPTDTAADLQALASEIVEVNEALNQLDGYVDGAFEDGIITQIEAKSIEKYINVLNAEQADLTARYNNLDANGQLTGSAKTNLASAKTAYNTAHTNLLSVINTAIADGSTTSAEKTSVDNSFVTYRAALATLSTRFEEAINSVSQAKATAAQTAATAAATTAYNNLTAQLRSLAYQDLVDLAVGGVTLITGGKINTVLLDAQAIQANIVNAGYINTLELSAVKGTIGGWSVGANKITASNGDILAPGYQSTTLNDDGSIELMAIVDGPVRWNPSLQIWETFGVTTMNNILTPKTISIESDSQVVGNFVQTSNQNRSALVAVAPPGSFALNVLGTSLFEGSMVYAVRNVNLGYQIKIGDHVLNIQQSSAGDILLPTTGLIHGLSYKIRKADAATVNVKAGGTTIVSFSGGSREIIYNGTTWMVM